MELHKPRGLRSLSIIAAIACHLIGIAYIFIKYKSVNVLLCWISLKIALLNTFFTLEYTPRNCRRPINQMANYLRHETNPHSIQTQTHIAIDRVNDMCTHTHTHIITSSKIVAACLINITVQDRRKKTVAKPSKARDYTLRLCIVFTKRHLIVTNRWIIHSETTLYISI